jgi:hypothetical protein
VARVDLSLAARAMRSVRAAPGWLRVVVLLLVPVTVFGVFVRFTGLYDVFCRVPDELAEMMPGLRLHALPLLNIRAPVSLTFVKSMFYSQHGLGDVSFYYLASSVLGLLGIPIAERNLFVVGGLVNLALAVVGVVFGARVLGKAAIGWIFAALVMVSPIYVFVSKSGWARLTWTPLVLLTLFLCQVAAVRRRGATWIVTMALLAGFVSLTDGFYVVSLIVVLAVLMRPGRLGERLRAVARDRIVLAGVWGAAAGIAADLAVVKVIGRPLTLMGYVLQRGARGSLVPSLDVLEGWAQGVNHYFPFPGVWLAMTVLAVLAACEGLRGRVIGMVAAWWFLGSIAVIRYLTGLEAAGMPPRASELSSFHVLLPSLLLTGWFLAALADGELPGIRWARAWARGAVAVAALALLLGFMARDAVAVAFDPPEAVRGDACRVVKAAAYYVRSHGGPSTYVFHLTSDVWLGHIGEFYYGLSYGGSLRERTRNHLLDFGGDAIGRRYTPEALAQAYGVTRFDYYVEFDPRFRRSEAAFATQAVDRLVADGARVVATIRDHGRAIGRILSFRDEPAVDLEYREAAAAWDHTFARPGRLLQEPLTGTAYHFGYQWTLPE